jgi:hypothetical protein
MYYLTVLLCSNRMDTHGMASAASKSSEQMSVSTGQKASSLTSSQIDSVLPYTFQMTAGHRIARRSRTEWRGIYQNGD